MAEIFIFISVSLIILLILIQSVSINFLYKDGFLVEFDYSFFSVSLSDKEKTSEFYKISPKLFSEIKRELEFLLSRSHVKINEIKIKTDESDPYIFGIKYRNVFSLFSAVTVYLSRKVKKLDMSDSSIVIFSEPEENSRFSLDLTVSAPLYIALVTAVKFLLLKSKNKRLMRAKRGQKWLKTK